MGHRTLRKSEDMKKAQRRATFFYWGMFALPLLQFIIFYLIVNMNSLLLAFKSYSFNKETLLYDQVFVGFDNFKTFFNDFFAQGGKLEPIFKNSLTLYLINLFVGTVLALLFSYYIFKKRFASQFFRVMLFMPSIISSVVLVTLYSYFVDRAVPDIVLNMFGTQMKLPLDAYPWQTVLIFNVFISFGTSVLLYSGAMSRIPDGVIEAGQIDGVNALQEFCILVIPMIAPTVSVFLITGVAQLFTNEANLYAFYGYFANSKIQTLGYYLLVQVKGENSTLANYPYAAAAGLSLALVAAPITLLVKYILDKVVPTVEY